MDRYKGKFFFFSFFQIFHVKNKAKITSLKLSASVTYADNKPHILFFKFYIKFS